MSNWNYADVWEAVADDAAGRRRPDPRGRTQTWAELDRRADGVARWLLGAGVSHQDKVALYLYNCPEYLEATFAASRSGWSRSTPTTATPTTSWPICGTTPTRWRWSSMGHSPSASRGSGIGSPGCRSWLWVDDGRPAARPGPTPYEEAAGRPAAADGSTKPVRAPGAAAARRHPHALHRRHDRACRRASCGARTTSSPGSTAGGSAATRRRRARRRPRRAGGQAGRDDPAARLPAHARDRWVHGASSA